MWEIMTNGTSYRLRNTETNKYEITYASAGLVAIPVTVTYKSLEEAKAARSKLEEAAKKHKQENTWVKVEDN